MPSMPDQNPASTPWLEHVGLLLRAEYPLIYAFTHEEDRFAVSVAELAKAIGRRTLTWRCHEGVRGEGEEAEAPKGSSFESALRWFLESLAYKNSVLLVHDAHLQLERDGSGARGLALHISLLREASR